MKLLLIATLLFSQIAFAVDEIQVLNSEPINVDGVVSEKPSATDNELEHIKSEIQKQKKEIVLNREKAKGFKALSKSTEALTETTVEMMEEKKAAKAEIAAYNEKVRCLQEESPGKDCEKYVKHRK